MGKGANIMDKLLAELRAHFPDLTFTPGKQFVWSPETQEVFYKQTAKGQKQSWSLLHETGHALLGHTQYRADIELLKMELAAWEKARQLAKEYDIKISEDHIQNCLDTYRDWLHARSLCPTCTTKSLQQSDYRHYRCHNCHTTWKVTPSRSSRPYRAVKGVKQSFTLLQPTDAL